ncbi:MAG: hypothetical protein ACP5R6_05565 [Chlorobaculum sp.]
MKKISGSTFYFKKVLPGIWFGFLSFFFVSSLLSGAAEKTPMLIVVPTIMAVFGYFLFKMLMWDLVDEVYDLGNKLLFRNNGREQRVNLRDIVNIGYSQMSSSPERIVVTVRNEGPLGKELAFNPPTRLFTFSKNPLVQELIERVDRARTTK